jgi:O-antigen/teichoic acid export membrane protein
MAAAGAGDLRPDEPAAAGLLSGGLRKTAAVLSVRALQIGSGVFVAVALPLCMTQDDVGLVLLTQSMIAIAATAAQLGLGNAASALVPAALALDDGGRARIVIGRSLALTGVAGILLGALLWLTLVVIDRAGVQGALAAMAIAAPLIAASVPLAALQHLLSEIYRGFGAALRGSLLASGVGLPVAAALMGAWMLGLRLSFDTVLVVGIAGLVLIAGLGGLGLAIRSRGWPRRPAQPLPMMELWSTAWPSLVSSLILLVLAQADLWLAALLSDAATLANYGLAIRMATLVILPLAIVNAVAGPMIAALWARRKRRVLQRLLHRTALVGGVAAIAGYGVVLLLGRPAIERLWGHDYSEAFLFFAILGLGQVCHGTGGSSGIALIALGRQLQLMRITAASGIATIGLAMIATAWLGIVGIAVAFSAGLAVQTWLFCRALRRACGLDATTWHALRHRRAGRAA